MKNLRHYAASLLLLLPLGGKAQSASQAYTPTPENLQSRQEFADSRLGIFIHWGIYSLFAQGEWYLHNASLDYREYAKAAGAFYPIGFDADAWVKAIKDAGAGYVCFTSRHHDSFSMFHTKQSPYNIVDATPFKRDVLKELADACHSQGLRLHLYYSHLDWSRPEYPLGRTGRGTHRPTGQTDWPAYYKFMNAQLTELLSSVPESALKDGPYPLLNKVLQYFEDHRDIARMLVSESGSPHLLKELCASISERCMGGAFRDQSRYSSRYATAGMQGMIVTWVEDGMRMPAGEMAQMIERMMGSSQPQAAYNPLYK